MQASEREQALLCGVPQAVLQAGAIGGLQAQHQILRSDAWWQPQQLLSQAIEHKHALYKLPTKDACHGLHFFQHHLLLGQFERPLLHLPL